jgi:hypothetical protein
VLEPYRGMWSNYLLSMAAPVESHLGVCKMLTGELDEAVTLLDEALVTIETKAPGLLPIGCLNLGEALVARGTPADRARAAELFARARHEAVRIGSHGYVQSADDMAARLGDGA